MTEPSSTRPPPADEGVPTMRYGHGRMPLFVKLAWLAFLVFGAWYVVTYLLTALGEELGA